MWSRLDPTDALDINYDALEDDFEARPAQALEPKPSARGVRPPRHRMLLPMQRAQNIGVFLTTLKMGPLQVRPALCNPKSALRCALPPARFSKLQAAAGVRLSAQHLPSPVSLQAWLETALP